MPLDFNEIRQLLATIAQTDITEVSLKSDDFELTVRKGGNNSVLSVGQAQLGGMVSPGLTPAPATHTAPIQLPEIATSRDNSATAQSPLAVNAAASRFIEVQSPMVGTFYRAPAPGEAPFVEVGDRVKVGQSVCIIEAMKLMNEIEAEVSGQVMEILVQNGEPVEYGQPLMRINPD
ncbi:MAG: acetyl-CoA carboxylase biotin carboxyl carrier protein [Sphaerospermopsis kisseleviana]|uniref:Biotin carboxyl carrier protein of acetyl-CoA carboxylase n=3 Tax=Sphaerospermopsis TaxID=752201 RepID=A0A480A389_9CYAN|nr:MULTISPECIES: acetyl-CoA carboxylase biotin carboxyl carrier protein [Sphaerospermopsis]MBD2133045.1 acetyl-CoA carboxylase biotin carboxyl carrier protein [Sphaerospermopsis sp. FACHB-1094]MBD2145777.1 acetyl-CoA carboxylase biotin carboxyl carrier protein [Sphaerospermopsis sp. FACHB-1194]BAZ80463.1 acetyl-CoA carboxylase biotin carboxyl carrier protein [Sphaerospermopsis kisseleviana NIES-73]MBE9235043.1 acetyl-CoA carboxylase biotin carboxyl carrier protein [Sphaerospermopsis aphanizomen